MSKSYEPRRLFYQNEKAHSIVTKDRAQTIARSMNIPVAILSSDNPTANTIVAVTPNNSTHTASTQSTSQKLIYHPYGFSPTAALVPIAFNGELHDISANGYLLGNGYRLFLPTLMRFVSPDSITPFKVLNSYAYCNGDPVNYTDPSGHVRSGVTINTPSNNTLRKNAFRTIAEINQIKKEISAHRTPRQKIESKIRKINSDLDTAASYNNASSLKEETRLNREKKQLEKELQGLPSQDNGLERLKVTKEVLYEELASQMVSMGLPVNSEGIAQLLPPAPKTIRDPIPQARTNNLGLLNRGETPARLRLPTDLPDALY